jgi:hypothetical protein
MLTVLAALDHMDQKVRIIFAIDITFMTVLVTWFFLLMRFQIFLGREVSKAVGIGTLNPPRSICGRLILFSMT